MRLEYKFFVIFISILIFLEIMVVGIIFKLAYLVVFLLIIEIIIASLIKDYIIEDDNESNSQDDNVIQIEFIEQREDDLINFAKCTICLQSNKEDIVKLTCGHLFHKDCLEKWISYDTICPICRINLIV